jgi:hypothetical protein
MFYMNSISDMCNQLIDYIACTLTQSLKRSHLPKHPCRLKGFFSVYEYSHPKLHIQISNEGPCLCGQYIILIQVDPCNSGYHIRLM